MGSSSAAVFAGVPGAFVVPKCELKTDHKNALIGSDDAVSRSVSLSSGRVTTADALRQPTGTVSESDSDEDNVEDCGSVQSPEDALMWVSETASNVCNSSATHMQNVNDSSRCITGKPSVCSSGSVHTSCSMSKKKVDEDKVKQLKRPNAASTLKLDNKLKQRQRDSLKKCKMVTSPAHRTKDLSRTVDTDKDHVISSLREKCQEFSRLVSTHEDVLVHVADNLHIYNDMSQLEAVLQQAAKERLQLEKRLAAKEHIYVDVEAQLNNVKLLEMSNVRLEAQRLQLAGELQDKEDLEVELMQWRIEADVLKKEMSVVQQRCQQLEKEISEVMLKNTELNSINSELQKQLDNLSKVNTRQEIRNSEAKHCEFEAQAAKEEVIELRENVDRLELELQCMKKLTEQNKLLELEKQSFIEQLRLKQLECDSLLQEKEADNCRHKTSMSHLEDRMAKLEKQCVDLTTEKLQMLSEIDEMKQRSSLDDDVGANVNMNNYVSGSASLSSDCLHFDDIADCDDTGVKPVDVSGCESSKEFVGSEAVRVFIALYDYDPYQSSPNDQPDIELPLSAGQHVFIIGDVDEDGFYSGTLTDGRCGLVPSNFVRQLYDEGGKRVNEMGTLQMSGRLQWIDAADRLQGINKDGDGLMLHVDGTQSVSDGSVTPQLHSAFMHTSPMHSDAVTMPTQTDIVSHQSSALWLDHRLTSDHDLLRPSSEPCVVTDDLCLESSVVQQSVSVDWTCVDVCAANIKSCNDTDSDIKVLSSYLKHVGDVPRQSVLTMNDSRVNDVGSTVTADERCRLQAGLVVSGSVWRKVEPRHSRHDAVTVKDSVLSAADSSVSPPPLQDTDDVDRPVHNDARCSVADVDDSSHSETGYDLTDNNAVTAHQLRDDITDGDLIDYSDDGTESLTDSIREQVHVFIALFDYDPATMSPNPDAVESELPFSEGDLIKVFGSEDADGFYYGECNGQRGLVPSNIVALVEVDDAETAMQILHDSGQSMAADDSRSSSQTSSYLSRQRVRGAVSDEAVHYMIAMYSYDPIELSPNIDADQELTFSRGDIIAVYGDADDDGFYFGELDGRSGLVPSNFLQEAPLRFSAS